MSRESYRAFKDLHWGSVYGAANRERAVPYEFPSFPEFEKVKFLAPEGSETYFDPETGDLMMTWKGENE